MQRSTTPFFPRLEEAIDYCDKFPLDDLPEDAPNLLHLIYSLVMVAMSVEIFAHRSPSTPPTPSIDRVSEPVP